MPANSPSSPLSVSSHPLGAAPQSATPPRFRRLWTRQRVFLVVLALAALSRLAWTLLRDASLDPMGGALVPGSCRIVAVEDDGTLQVVQPAGRLQSAALAAPASMSPVRRVRLLGVHLASAARPTAGPSHPCRIDPGAGKWLRRMVVDREARLEFDRRRFDQQGCWLAYVFVGEQLLNVELIRAGWGQCEPMTGDATARQRALRQAESEARRAGRGVWRRIDLELVPASPRS